MAEEKEKKKIDRSLEGTLLKLEKDFGKGTVIGGKDKGMEVEFIPTGSIGLDRATGIGGYACGRIIEIYGPESTGKTTLALTAVAKAQKKFPDKRAVYIDIEHSLDTGYAQDLGVDLEALLISQPNYGEQALEVADRLIQTGKISIVVIDSVAALVPKAELDGEMGDSKLGLQSRLMSQAMRKLTAITENSGTLLIFINQLREKIGVMFGNPETTTGGNALKFYASQRFDIRKVLINKEDDVAVSNGVRVKVVKNKLAPPFTQAEFNILYGKGIDRMNEVLEYGVENGVIEKSGAWYSYQGEKIGQGKENVFDNFTTNPSLYEEIEIELLKKL